MFRIEAATGPQQGHMTLFGGAGASPGEIVRYNVKQREYSKQRKEYAQKSGEQCVMGKLANTLSLNWLSSRT